MRQHMRWALRQKTRQGGERQDGGTGGKGRAARPRQRGWGSGQAGVGVTGVGRIGQDWCFDGKMIEG